MSKPEFKILYLDQELKKLAEQCVSNDIHCQPDYLELFAEYQPAEVIYAFYGDENDYVLVPFLKKTSLGNGSGEKYFDLVSPWYYGGPIYRSASQAVALENFKHLREELNKYCLRNNIVSEFQRMNPLLENHLFYQEDSGLSHNRDIVYIDLDKPLPRIRSEYAYKVRKNIQKAENAGLRLVHSKSEADWKKFIEVYLSSMREKQAGAFYYFNDDFFAKFFKKFHAELEIFKVEHQGKTIAATLVLGKYGVLHDYLRGSMLQYVSLRPNDFMVDGIISWAKDAGYSSYSLCGGFSADTNDPLLNFKKSFSPLSKKFYLYKKVHNLAKYRELCLSAGKKEDELAYEQASFFPEYARH